MWTFFIRLVQFPPTLNCYNIFPISVMQLIFIEFTDRIKLDPSPEFGLDTFEIKDATRERIGTPCSIFPDFELLRHFSYFIYTIDIYDICRSYIAKPMFRVWFVYIRNERRDTRTKVDVFHSSCSIFPTLNCCNIFPISTMQLIFIEVMDRIQLNAIPEFGFDALEMKDATRGQMGTSCSIFAHAELLRNLNHLSHTFDI